MPCRILLVAALAANGYCGVITHLQDRPRDRHEPGFTSILDGILFNTGPESEGEDANSFAFAIPPGIHGHIVTPAQTNCAPPPPETPEPSTFYLLLAGAAALWGLARRSAKLLS